jgi:hypothetical protein
MDAINLPMLIENWLLTAQALDASRKNSGRIIERRALDFYRSTGQAGGTGAGG